MTLLTLGASKINQGDLQRTPNGEYGKGTPIGVPPTVACEQKETMPSQYSDFPKADQFFILGTFGQWSWRPKGHVFVTCTLWSTWLRYATLNRAKGQR